MWKKCIKQASENTSLLVVKDHRLRRGSRIIILKELRSQELYSLLISAINHLPTSQKYFYNLFPHIELPWKETYLTARKVTANSLLRCLNYKIINNVFCLNEKLFQFGNTDSPLCFFVILKLKQHFVLFINVQLLKSLVPSLIIFWNKSWLSWFNTAGCRFWFY